VLAERLVDAELDIAQGERSFPVGQTDERIDTAVKHGGDLEGADRLRIGDFCPGESPF
jgi:hypothetical protein